MVREIFAALAVLALLGCGDPSASEAEPPRPANGSVVTISAARLVGDASADARLAHAGGQSHLYAVMGEGLMFPGAIDADATRLGYLVIRETSDAVGSGEEQQFNAAAHRYAETWNSEMLRLDAAS